MATTTSTPFALTTPRQQISTRDVAEMIFGFGLIMLILWLPERAQIILGPLALAATLSVVMQRRPSRDELGLSGRSLISSLWILPASVAVTVASVLLAGKAGTLHPLYTPGLAHIGGYVLWTIYQQFLLQVYFMPRLLRILPSDQVAITLAASLFAAAHLPNLPLTAATLVWGAVSCTLFLRYRNVYILGLAQGLLGLCFAICVPDALHHHMRVGLGYLHYHGTIPLP